MAIQVGETFRPSQSAIFPPSCVTREPVIPSTLYIQRDQIQAAWDARVGDWILEQVIGQLRRDVSGRHLDHVSGRRCDGTPQPALRVQAVRVEQHPMQLHIGGGARPLVGHPHQSGQQGVGESEGGRGKTVRYTRIDSRVIQFPLLSVARSQRSQIPLIRLLIAQNYWHELPIRDVLQLGADHSSRLLVQRLVVPRRVDPRQSLGHPVVLPGPQQVHRGQVKILVRPRVPCRETVSPPAPLGLTVAAVVGIRARGQEGSIVGGQLHPQTAAPELAQILGRVLLRPVNHRSVYERRYL